MPIRKPSDRKLWAVYIVKCANGALYTGIAADLDSRLAAHNAGKGAKYTAPLALCACSGPPAKGAAPRPRSLRPVSNPSTAKKSWP